MIIFPAKPSHLGNRAFTLVEVMIGATLGSIILLGVLTTFVMVIKHGLAAANYSVMESQSRRAFEQLAIDAKMASGVTGTTSTSVTFTFSPSAVPSNYAGSNAVTYAFGSGIFYLIPGTVATPATSGTVLIRNVTAVNFTLSDKAGNTWTSGGVPPPIGGVAVYADSTAADAGAKYVQVAITASGSSVASTESMVSAAFTMRNKL